MNSAVAAAARELPSPCMPIPGSSPGTDRHALRGGRVREGLAIRKSKIDAAPALLPITVARRLGPFRAADLLRLCRRFLLHDSRFGLGRRWLLLFRHRADMAKAHGRGH